MGRTITEGGKYFMKGVFVSLAVMLLVLSATAFRCNGVLAEEAGYGKLQVTFQKYNKSYKLKNGKIYMRLSYQEPQAAGDSKAARAINKFYKAERIRWRDSHKQDRKAAARQQGCTPWKDEILNCRVSFQNASYISIYQEGYYYQGGAHGMPYRVSHIFSVTTGQQVTASEILEMTDSQVNAEVRQKYVKLYKKTRGTGKYPFFDYKNDKGLLQDLKKIDFAENQMYYLEKGKLVFYADPYLLGPYASNFIEVSFRI